MRSVSFILLALVGTAFGVSCPEEGQHFFPHPLYCSKFIECNDGISQEQDCFGDLIFNPEVGYCDFAENYPCEDTQKPVGKCPPMNNINEYFLADAGSCEVFYMCNFGEAIAMTCPNGLHFSPLHWVCDWPEQAGCTVEKKKVS